MICSVHLIDSTFTKCETMHVMSFFLFFAFSSFWPSSGVSSTFARIKNLKKRFSPINAFLFWKTRKYSVHCSFQLKLPLVATFNINNMFSLSQILWLQGLIFMRYPVQHYDLKTLLAQCMMHNVCISKVIHFDVCIT